MDTRQLQALDRRLADFLSTLTASMGRAERRRWAEVYVRGLLLDGERKSIEPLAARAGGDVQGLQQFIGQSPWAAEAVQQALNARMSAALAPSAYWIVDETSFPKQGAHSVGVARQYCGALGKIANCQVAVSLHWSNGTASWPLGWRLYLPESWAADPARRRKAGVPAEVAHASKTQLALELIQAVRAQGVPPGIVLADSFYGDGFVWRAQLHEKGLGYVVGVEGRLGVWLAPETDARPARPGGRQRLPPRAAILALRTAAIVLPKKSWRRIGTGKIRSRFARFEVLAANRSPGHGKLPRWHETALVEWPHDAPEPTRFWLCWLPDQSGSLEDLVRHAKARWRIEQDYRELKDELGLDHFEGRTWVGWHHHVTLVTLAFAFLRLEQRRSKKNSAPHAARHPPPSPAPADPA